MPEIARKLTTVLAADVVGYSRLAGADEEGTVSRLRALRHELVDPVVAAHGGRVFKIVGDGRMVEFGSVVDAVRCALEVQSKMAGRNADIAPDRRLLFRVGIHLGDVMVESDGDLMGDGVNIAARLEGISEPGGICLSEDAWRQVRDKIATAFVDLGERDLKNIARPMRVYAISPSPPRGGGEGWDEVGNSRARTATSPSRAVGAGPALSATRRGEDGPPRLSIVVLPFAIFGGDPEQEYFVDGVTESLTTDLSRVSGCFVIARNTAFTYKGKPFDVKQIGRELKVRYALEGSVQRGGNRLRVNVQLIDTENGLHLWAERFDKPVADLFDMQDEIVARLANQLGTEMVAAEARRAEKSPHPDATDLYFQGRAWLNKGTNPEHFQKAHGFFAEALALDPDHVEALVGQAYISWLSSANFQTDTGVARLADGEVAATRALKLASNHAAAHFVLGCIYVFTGRSSQGISEYERALALDRNLAEAHAGIGFAKAFTGAAEAAEPLFHEALRLSPRDTNVYLWLHFLGAIKQFLRADEEATVWYRRSIEVNRNYPLVHFFLASTLAHLGRLDEARAEVQVGLRLNPSFTLRRFHGFSAGSNPTYLAQREHLADGMRQAGVPE
jgi:TolB-like protein/class 3 adenylate cyclase